MAHRVNLEVGRNIKNHGYYRGLNTWIIVDGSITIDELYTRAEKRAKDLCVKRGEEFVEVIINGIQKDYAGSQDTSPLGIELP